MMKILIAYGSKYGSTRSIAERIHDRLAAANIGEVTLAPFDKKLSINDFGQHLQSTEETLQYPNFLLPI